MSLRLKYCFVFLTIQRDIPLLLDRYCAFLIFPPQSSSIKACIRLAWDRCSPPPTLCACTLCFCSTLSIHLLATSAFPLKLLTFTSDVCIFPVVERPSSPSVSCYSSYAVFLPAEWSEYKRDRVYMFLSVSRSTLVVSLVGHLLDLNNPVPPRIPSTVVVMDCPTNPASPSTTFSLYITCRQSRCHVFPISISYCLCIVVSSRIAINHFSVFKFFLSFQTLWHPAIIAAFFSFSSKCLSSSIPFPFLSLHLWNFPLSYRLPRLSGQSHAIPCIHPLYHFYTRNRLCLDLAGVTLVCVHG